MSRLTLRLPDNLHRQLQVLAVNEGIPLDQYIVEVLSQHVSIASSIQAVPEKAVIEQRVAYNILLQNLGEASFDQIQAALAERETVSPEDGLSPEVVERIRRRTSKGRS
jgi:hypothetical protein